MFLVNLVRLLLLVGVLYESGVDATEQLREQPSELRGEYLYTTDHGLNVKITVFAVLYKELCDEPGFL